MPNKEKISYTTACKRPSRDAINNIRKKAAENEKRVHVFSNREKWAVKKEGALRASKIFSTKEEAIKNAKEFVRKGKAKSVISHKRDGSFIRIHVKIA